MIFGLYRSWKRRRLLRRPFPEAWGPILEEHVPFYKDYQPAEQQRFRDLVKVFVWDKVFIPAGGQEVDDVVRVVIAACAVRLVLNLDLSYYDELTEIIVYPDSYRHPNHTGTVLGEAHDWGTVVLSWKAVREGLADEADGHDTAAHEFAHVLDRAGGAFDGTPVLESRGDYGPWARVMSSHYLALQHGRRKERKVLRDYGATNEAEFFAVATESFFERPLRMRKLMPDLYEEMQAFYGGDPAERRTLVRLKRRLERGVKRRLARFRRRRRKD